VNAVASRTAATVTNTSRIVSATPPKQASAWTVFRSKFAVPADIGLTSGYGIGFQVDRRDNYVAFGHGGPVAGYTSMLLVNRSKGIGVIVFSNGASNPTSLAERSLDILSK
jgi:CubicO group peptidase (beta-lactamase class C family)